MNYPKTKSACVAVKHRLCLTLLLALASADALTAPVRALAPVISKPPQSSSIAPGMNTTAPPAPFGPDTSSWRSVILPEASRASRSCVGVGWTSAWNPAAAGSVAARVRAASFALPSR